MEAAELRTVIAGNIRRIANDRGVALPALADFAEVSRAQLYDVLAGTKAPTSDGLAKIASALEVEPHVLLKPGS